MLIHKSIALPATGELLVGLQPLVLANAQKVIMAQMPTVLTLPAHALAIALPATGELPVGLQPLVLANAQPVGTVWPIP